MHVYNRYDSEHRSLSAPLMFVALQDELSHLKQDSEWVTRHRNAVTLVKTNHLSVVLVALQQGASLKEHHTGSSITVMVLRGKIAFKTRDQERHVESNGLVFLEAGIPHEVKALEESALLVTIVEPKSATGVRKGAAGK